MAERRRTERVFLRVPIVVQGVDLGGNRFSEETSTVEVNRDGARIALRHTPRLGAEVRIANQSTNFTALFRVTVQCPQSYGGAPEWGVALSATMPDLMSDFWGVAFEDLGEEDKPHITALLLCRACGRQELVSITRAEYEVLRQSQRLPRVCPKCHKATEWEPAGPERSRTAPVRTVSDVGPTEASSPAGAQRRGARRIAVQVPILVRCADGSNEETLSRDVSKTGLSFPTALALDKGDAIDVVVGHGVVASPTTQRARVAWRRPEAHGSKALVGVQFIAPEEPEAQVEAPEPGN